MRDYHHTHRFLAHERGIAMRQALLYTVESNSHQKIFGSRTLMSFDRYQSFTQLASLMSCMGPPILLNQHKLLYGVFRSE